MAKLVMCDECYAAVFLEKLYEHGLFHADIEQRLERLERE